MSVRKHSRAQALSEHWCRPMEESEEQCLEDTNVSAVSTQKQHVSVFAVEERCKRVGIAIGAQMLHEICDGINAAEVELQPKHQG